MGFTVAVISAGAMGGAIGARLASHGATVLTSLDGRGAASRERATAGGMKPASDERIAAQAAVILSIVPPAEAVGLAERLAAPLANAVKPAIYVDCNAISVSAVTKIGKIMNQAGVHFIDGGIIGGPPEGDQPGPLLYVSGDLSGDVAPDLAELERCGLRIHYLDGPIGAASALKLSYAGITKGLTAIGAAMILAAERVGAGPALKQELGASQPQILARLSKSLPDMYQKAYRWVDEMRFIAEFVGATFPEAGIFDGAAGLYQRLAENVAGAGKERTSLDVFLAR